MGLGRKIRAFSTFGLGKEMENEIHDEMKKEEDGIEREGEGFGPVWN